MKKIVSFLFILFLISNVLALCEDNQIDINSASKTQLDKLTGIGPVKADAIINARPFNSLDDLIDVYGIGEVTLENIKMQGLACVTPKGVPPSTENKNLSEEGKPEPENIKDINKSKKDSEIITGKDVISLSPKDIKSSSEDYGLSKTKYLAYGFVLFCALLIVLFVLRKFKENEKSEFD